MIHSNDLYDVASIKSFDEKSEDLTLLEDSNDYKFQECFTKIFAKNNPIEIESETESYFFMKEKPSFHNNSFNLNENKENTMDKSKLKSLKNENEEENNLKALFSNLSSDKSISLLKNINNNPQKESPVISYIQIKKEKNEKENENFLGKKRNMFKIDYPKDFAIFSYGQFNNYSRKMIDEVMDELGQNTSKEDLDETKSKSGNKKKSYKKIVNVQKRKENADNIRKKIKSRFLKYLRNIINERLKAAGSKKFFKYLPQKFICNVSKEKNKAVLNLSLKEILLKNFCEENIVNKNNPELKNYYHNLEVLEYLEQNNEISEKSNFKNFKNMKYFQMFNEYLKSKEFEKEIASLKKEKENDKYIKNYIIKASDLMEFFAN